MADQQSQDGSVAARQAAVWLLGTVQGLGLMLPDALARADCPLPKLPPSDRARAQALADRVLRHLDALDSVLDRFLDKPPPLRVRNVLRVCAVELLVDGIAAHGAVNAAVSVTRASPKTRHLAGLTNAVARKLSGLSPADLPKGPQALPKAIRGALVKTYGPDITAAIEAAHGVRPALDLTLRDPGSAGDWAKTLQAEPLPNGSLRLARSVQVSALQGFSEGAWWVQDAAASTPVRLLDDLKGKRVLDLCAAPGGKTLQLAAAGADVTALDISDPRMARVRENLERVGLKATCVVADALKWEPDAPFDAVLLDVPCSATGTIRRHPDLPVVRPSLELKSLLTLQATLLDRAAGWLKPGGQMVYATCSLIEAEGERQIARAQDRLPHLQPVPIDAAALGFDREWTPAPGQLRLRPDYWPKAGGMDGFYMAKLVHRG